MIYHGDSLEVLRTLEENSIDAVVTDPPYGLSFMGKKWDYDVPSVDLFRSILRVLKPGGHILSFGGTRTYHRLACNIEDAGFEIRDQIQWIYGSGFPKSMNVALAIDKQSGAIGHRGKAFNTSGAGSRQKDLEGTNGHGEPAYKEAKTDAAKQWQGFGTALKPANEPIVLARKPLSESTVAKNVLKYGTGALNIDGTRIGTERIAQHQRDLSQAHGDKWAAGTKQPVLGVTNYTTGRWPANVLFDESAAEMLDEQSGVSGDRARTSSGKSLNLFGGDKENIGQRGFADKGGASRFFYVAKASKRERNAGLEGMPEISKSHLASPDGGGGGWSKDSDKNPNLPRANHHPTVKPIKLMEYLCKLITPPGGVILDPFCGSGSTGVAAVNLGFKFIGIEREKEYVAIAEKRIANARPDEALKEVDEQLCLSI